MSTATPDWCEYSDVEYTRERAAISSVFALAPQTDPASRLSSEKRDFIYLFFFCKSTILLLHYEVFVEHHVNLSRAR